MYKVVKYDPNFKPEKVFCEVGTKAILQNAAGEILLLLRSTKVGISGKWGLPGDGLELLGT